MNRNRIRLLAAAVVLAPAVVLTTTGSAQNIQSQPLPQISEPPQAQRGAQAQQGQKGARPQGGTTRQPAESGGAAGEAQLRQRVEQLEEQLTDMHVVIGTLESLAKTTGGAAPAPAYRPPQQGSSVGGADTQRIEALETQVRALTAQVEQLTNQLRATGRRTDAGPPETSANPRGGRPGGFGSMTVTPGSRDDIGEFLAEEDRNRGASPGPATAALEGGSPEDLYKTAYGYLLQQNYGAAEAAFDQFLKRYPTDAMAGNAQFWLGEVYFVQGQFKQAAGAFLKGSRNYARSVKAPDSLMKLAMSLDRMGQRDAACQAFTELTTRYPSPPTHLKERLQSERQRAGC